MLLGPEPGVLLDGERWSAALKLFSSLHPSTELLITSAITVALRLCRFLCGLWGRWRAMEIYRHPVFVQTGLDPCGGSNRGWRARSVRTPRLHRSTILGVLVQMIRTKQAAGRS